MADRTTAEKALSDLLLKFRTDWTAFNDQVVGFPVPLQPTMLDFERGEFRLAFLREELTELERAISDEKLDDAVDALIDLIYVAVGTLGEMGVTVQPTWDEVQRANMKKRRGEKSTRSGSGGYDVVKPWDWTGPNHLPYLSITSDDVEALALMKAPQGRVGLGGDALCIKMSAEGDTYYNLTRDELALLNQAKAQTLPNRDGRDVQQLELKLDATPALEVLAKFKEGAPVHVHHLEDRKPRILVLGHGRHGKDTVCEILKERYGLQFTSSSWFCAERVVMPALNGQFQYKDAQACYEDRHNHRALWYDLIRDFNRPDATALGRAIFAENDVYCGLRSKAEFHALRNAGVYDYAIWVDASDRVPPEDASSCTVEPWMADFVIDNNGTLEDLELNLKQLMEYVL